MTEIRRATSTFSVETVEKRLSELKAIDSRTAESLREIAYLEELRVRKGW